MFNPRSARDVAGIVIGQQGVSLSIEFALDGIKEMHRFWERFDDKIKRKILRKSVNASCRPVVKKVRALAPKQTGLLRRSLTHKIKNYRKGAIFVAIAGQRVDGATKAFERAAIKAQSDKRRGGLSAKGKAVPIHLVESRVRPHTLKARPLENVMVPAKKRGMKIASDRFMRLLTGVKRGTLVFRRFGRIVRTKQVKHPGNSGDGFMRRAADATRGDSLREFEKKWKTEISALPSGPTLPGGK